MSQRFFPLVLSIVLLFVASLPVLIPLLVPGFPRTDDGDWLIIRLSAFYEAFRDGQFPVRWLGRLNDTYGYPVANFLYPGYLYLGVPFIALNVGLIGTAKLLFSLTMLGSAVFMYLWLQRLFPLLPSVAGAIVYLYAPYHLFDFTTRGSLGELLALAVVPFILWSIERKSYLWSGLGVGLLLLSHNTLAAMFLPFILLYAGITVQHVAKREAVLLLSAVLLGVCSAAFFWIPALYDLQYTVFSQTVISQWQNYFADWSLIGIVPGVVGVGSALLLVRRVLTKKETLSQLHKPLLFFGMAVAGLLFSLTWSSPLWEVLPVQFVQFPFRFLSLFIFGIGFLTAYILSIFKYAAVVSGIVMLVSIVTALPYLQIEESRVMDEGYYSTNQATTTVKDEYMPIWVNSIPSGQPESPVRVQEGEVAVVSKKAHRIEFVVTAPEETLVSIHEVYFPGWKTFVNGKEAAISSKNDSGLIQLRVPEGKHSVQAVFTETPVRLLADMISGGSVLLLLLISGFQLWKKR